MGQAASYAESSVQRALLRLKHEEQTEEEELLRACGYSVPSPSSVPSTRQPTSSTAPPPPPPRPPQQRRDGCSSAERRSRSTASSSSASSSPLPPAPESLGAFVSLEPAYYSLDELRDALRHLPDALWVSLYRVSLLYILDNDHDGRVKPTDINLFMDWSIKTVGSDVPPEQLAEVLQTHAALHCWRRCLQVGEELEAECAAAAAQQSVRGGAASSSAARNRRRPLPAGGLMSGGLGGGGGSSSPHHHHHPQTPSISSFMLLHLREAFLSSRPGGPVPLPSNAPTAPTSKVAVASTTKMTRVGNGLTSPVRTQFFSPRSAVTQPVTATARLEAAAHFGEWMLRLVQNQERDRRLERQRFERRLRCLSACAETRLGESSRLRHSQLLQHHTMRLRGGSMAMLPMLADGLDNEDVVPSRSTLTMRSGVGVNDSTEPEMVAMMARQLSLPDSDAAMSLPACASPAPQPGGTPAKLTYSPSLRNLTPPGVHMMMTTASAAAAAAHGARSRPLVSETSPQRPQHRQQQQQQKTSLPSRALPSFLCALNSAPSEDNILLSSQTKVDFGGAEGQSSSPQWTSRNGNGNTVFSPAQLSAVLMDSEDFYAELERNGWCTIGAVEEAYLDFAVEDSYCLSFWAFCRLLNASSAEEMEAALELTTAQATAVLTSAAAVEDYRRSAAVRQLQRLHSVPHRTASQAGSWEANLEVVPVFIVSEYTYVTFVAAFIHAYWDMLESMGIEAVTQPAETMSMAAGQSNAAGVRALQKG